jgi:NADH-quinone oxidoreductase subunit L
MSVAVVLLPLIGAAIAGVLALVEPRDKAAKHRIDIAAQWVTCGALLLAMVLAILVFIDVAIRGNTGTVVLFNWITSGDLDIHWGLKLDTLTVVMMLVVTVVSAMVHVYSVGYMHHDPGIPRFMSYLNLFTFFMLVLVTADNLLLMFVGGEGGGLAS